MRCRFAFIAALLVVSGCLPAVALAQHAPMAFDPWLSVPSVSGFEADIRDAIRQALPPGAKPRVDEIGNLIVTFGTGKPHLLVCTNVDEDGFFVSAITDTGYLRVQRVTTGVTNRLFEQMHYGQPMWIRTQSGKHVPGVFVTASSHLQRGRDQAPGPKSLDDLWIDVGAQSRAEVEKLGVQMLDPVSLRERSQSLANDRVAGVNAQGRAAAFALKVLADGVAAQAAAKRLSGTVTIAFTTQGSFGERGMARLAQQFPDVDRVIVVARTPMPRDANNAKGAVGQLGAGVIVADTDAQAIAQARQHQVTVQPVAGAVRPAAAWPAAKTQVFALPVLYAQTPVEVVSTSDFYALQNLLLVSATSQVGIQGGITGGIGAQRSAEGTGLVGVLGTLVGLPAVSGAEGPVREAVTGLLPKWAKPEIDQRGNVTVTFGQPTASGNASSGKGAKELVFVAHMDEIGYEITDILEDGTATVRKRGGFFDYLWEAHPVSVVTTKAGLVGAVVAPRPNYLRAADAAPKPEDVMLYFGTTSRAETEALGVAKGNTATIHKQLTQLAGARWTARAMDDRCGVAALLDALRTIDPAKVANRVTFAFVVGEETGLEGSGFLAQRSHPAAVFAIDTFVSSDSPVDPQRMALVPLGSGAVARAIDSSSITPPDVVARVVSIGRAHQIPVTPATTSGGNDGSQFSRYGSVVVPLSWPGRYSHSPVEVMDLRDLNNLVGLIRALVDEF
ncbi:MAG: M20/M25/M40 family metallo-hydrolase [Bacteroidales bacterium]